MALVLKDRVVESSASSGTGTFVLDGAQTGYQSFAAIGNGNTTYYTIEHPQTSEWEVGVGTYNANTLSRDTVLDSSNGGALVYFSIGQKNVFVDLPAEKVSPTDTLGTMAYQNANAVAVTGGSINGTPIGATTPSTIAATTGSFSGVTSFAAGSASAPSITRTGDTNTGIFFPAADTIAFTEGGTEAMRITSSGNVGIGTNSPTVRLEVQGDARISNTTEAVLSLAGGTSNFQITATESDYAVFNAGGSGLGFGVTYGSGLFVCENSTGRIGVGTTTPTTELDVVGTGKFTAVTTPAVTAPTNNLTLSAISTGAVKFNTLGGLQAQINDATTSGQYTLLARGTGNTQKITAFGTANLALQSTGGGTIQLRTGDETNTQLAIGHTASAVNRVDITGSATTKTPVYSVSGSDSNISMAFQPKGTGAINLATVSSGVNISNGGTVTAITRTNTGSGYTSVPSVAISAPTTAGGVQATASANMFVFTVTVASGGTGYTVGDILSLVGGTGAAGQVTVATVSGGVITGITNGPSNGLYSALPTTPAATTGGTGSGATINITGYGVSNFTITAAGSGYIEQPTVTFSGGGGSGAAAFATVGSGTAIRNLGSTLSFNVPAGESFRVSSAFLTSTSANYIDASGRSAGLGPVLSTNGSDANVRFNITSKGTDAIGLYTNLANQLQFNVTHTASAVNYVQVTGGATGSPPIISAQGSNADIDISLTPKGTGRVRFGTYTGTILTPTGFIEIKDSGGTTRRLLVG